MKLTELLLLGLALWTVIGVVGSLLWRVCGDRKRARRGALWIAGVWGLYLLVLVGVSWRQPRRELRPGSEQCFDEMCFAVVGADEIEGFWAKGQERERLVRARVRIVNRGRSGPESEKLVRAYLLDAQGRRWEEVRGLSGVRLTTRVSAGEMVVSEPVFRVSRDTTGLSLVLTHGHWQPGVLVIGDPDSWGHRPTVMSLDP